MYVLSLDKIPRVSGGSVATTTTTTLGSGLGGLIGSLAGPVGTVIGGAIGAGLGAATGENLKEIGNALVKMTEISGANMHRDMPGGGMPIAYQ